MNAVCLLQIQAFVNDSKPHSEDEITDMLRSREGIDLLSLPCQSSPNFVDRVRTMECSSKMYILYVYVY